VEYIENFVFRAKLIFGCS